MSGIAVPSLEMTDIFRGILESLSRESSLSVSMNKRVQIVLMGSEGLSNYRIAKQLGVDVNTVIKWRSRWSKAFSSLSRINEAQEILGKAALRNMILKILKDRARPGAPRKFTLSQREQIVALACEKPEDHGLPITNWTGKTLAETAVKKGIVEEISGGHTNRILKK